jgi:hypothetical protein
MRTFISRFSLEIGFLLTILAGIILTFGYTVPLQFFQLGKAEYKSLTGILLCVFIFDQWRVSRMRFAKTDAKKIRKEVGLHKLFGLAAPILFFMHSQHLGNGYFLLLTFSFFSLFISGVIHDKMVTLKNPTVTRISIIVHIALATLLVGSVAYHIYALAYFGLIPKSRL